MTIECFILSSSTTSRVVVRGLASMMALSWSLSPSDSQPLRSSSSRLPPSLQNFLNHHYSFISTSSDKCVVDVASRLCCLMTHFELEFKNCSNLPSCSTVAQKRPITSSNWGSWCIVSGCWVSQYLQDGLEAVGWSWGEGRRSLKGVSG